MLRVFIPVLQSQLTPLFLSRSIIRKIKLSPSNRFNRKLAPVDFGDNRRDSDIFAASQADLVSPNNGSGEAWPLHRSPSQSSTGHGNTAGMRRGSDSDDGKSYGGPQMSETGHGAASFYPAMPPPAVQPQQYPEYSYGGPQQEYYGGGYQPQPGPGLSYGQSMRRPNW